MKFYNKLYLIGSAVLIFIGFRTRTKASKAKYLDSLFNLVYYRFSSFSSKSINCIELKPTILVNKTNKNHIALALSLLGIRLGGGQFDQFDQSGVNLTPTPSRNRVNL